MGDGISVDPPLRRESRKVYASSRGQDSEGEDGRKIGEVKENVQICAQ